MEYLAEFRKRIQSEDFSGLLKLWEEYTSGDKIDSKECCQILAKIKESQFSNAFGPYVETALPLWSEMSEEEDAYEVLKHLIDLQTTNSKLLGEISHKALLKKYSDHPHFLKWIKLVGLRNFDQFQGAISNFELLVHMQKGKYVFHKGGWGTGEIIEISPILEQVSIEFENVNRRRDLSFENAFKTLIPLSDDHFLARRFGSPDTLEAEAKKDSNEILKLLLRDLGPKTASEIKDELCDLVIPEEEWTKWWQLARTKAKKDTMIDVPSSVKGVFSLHDTEVSHEQRMQKEIHGATQINEMIQTTYNYVRDFPNMLKKEEVKNSVFEKLNTLFEEPDLAPHQELEISLFLETYFGKKQEGKSALEFLKKSDQIVNLVNAIEIQFFKKKALEKIRKHFDQWTSLFLHFLMTVPQNSQRDYLLKELLQDEKAKNGLIEELKALCKDPAKFPEAFVWYFQKVMTTQGIPFSDKEGQWKFMEAFLILFSKIELDSEYRELIKKMYNLLSGKRFAIVRSVLEGSNKEFVHEFLLLVSKCRTLGDHDVSILRSLVQVVHPDLAKEEVHRDENVIWTTEQGYRKAHDRAKQIAIDMIANAKDIETARALGDLRENAEYKSALERRSRLQSELRVLSEQLNRSRLITEQDIHTEEVGIGSAVDLQELKGNRTTYLILGPWDADPDNNILSFQSKLAQSMKGLKKGDSFTFREYDYQVERVRSYLECVP